MAKEIKPERVDWQRPGDCESCGLGPLHSPTQSCCSFERNHHRLCRTCTLGLDLVTTGSSRIRGAPKPDEWRRFNQLQAQGQQATKVAQV